jgi:hypothetical protein
VLVFALTDEQLVADDVSAEQSYAACCFSSGFTRLS